MLIKITTTLLVYTLNYRVITCNDCMAE